MKRLLVAVSVCLAFTSQANAQTPYVVTEDGGSKILNGIITKYILMNHQEDFKWFATNQQSANTGSPLIQAMQAAPVGIHFLVFGGTWCEDTQNVLPKFFKMQELAGFPDARIAFIGVDRTKKSIGNLATVMGITNVPTIIVLQNGVEKGRVIEYGKTGRWDEELSALIK
ncbi:MAG TPA: thioredoxin family protein [Ferruginibacter sp.]|nr:thioredoxin family protein [Ferruginibacter sp.]HRO16942.1 thioredoxin family protein [Ferruginibacter sp.]HRQ20595.1 thioredoxin family protein [Ferruginibacter sp.]